MKPTKSQGKHWKTLRGILSARPPRPINLEAPERHTTPCCPMKRHRRCTSAPTQGSVPLRQKWQKFCDVDLLSLPKMGYQGGRSSHYTGGLPRPVRNEGHVPPTDSTAQLQICWEGSKAECSKTSTGGGQLDQTTCARETG